MSAVSDQWCRTTIDETPKTTFAWTIEHFKRRTEKVGERITSSAFIAKNPNEKKSTWQLQFARYKGEKSEENNLAIFLKNCDGIPVKAKYSVSILDSSSKSTNTWNCPDHLFDEPHRVWGNRTWARQSILNNADLLPEGHLTIFCELTVYGMDKGMTLSGSRDVETSRSNARGLEQVSEDFGKLFNDKEFSDVEIMCDEKIFHCHKAILSTRVDFFRAMFQAEMVENRTNKVTIKDMSSEVAREMLQFIYMGTTNENVLKEMAGELLVAADKYQLDVLKSICEDHLCASLQIDNAVENLVFGDLNQASKLRRMAMKVIARNLVKVVKTEEYQNLFKHHPSLAAEIPMALVEDKVMV